jgi:hypothetical protein
MDDGLDQTKRASFPLVWVPSPPDLNRMEALRQAVIARGAGNGAYGGAEEPATTVARADAFYRFLKGEADLSPASAEDRF